MTRSRKGNPNWGKPTLETPAEVVPTAFENIVRQLGLAPHQYSTSASLRTWVVKHHKHSYVPESLLITWGYYAQT